MVQVLGGYINDLPLRKTMFPRAQPATRLSTSRVTNWKCWEFYKEQRCFAWYILQGCNAPSDLWVATTGKLSFNTFWEEQVRSAFWSQLPHCCRRRLCLQFHRPRRSPTVTARPSSPSSKSRHFPCQSFAVGQANLNLDNKFILQLQF